MLDASLEVRSAVVYASLIVILAFLPVYFLEGLAGSFFRPLATAYILAILASLAVALTVTPALALMLLPKVADRQSSDAPLVAWLKVSPSRPSSICCSCPLRMASPHVVSTESIHYHDERSRAAGVSWCGGFYNRKRGDR